MKILVVCQYYYPEPFRITDICEELVKCGHEVTVITGTPNYPMGEIYDGYQNGIKQDENIRGVKVHRCKIHPRKTGTLHRFLNYYSYAYVSSKYIQSLPDDFDVVFINQLSPVLMAKAGIKYAKKNGKKTVLYCLDLWPESLVAGGISRKSPIYKLFHKESAAIYKAVSKIMVTSRSFSEYFKREFSVNQVEYLPQYAEDLFTSEQCHKEPDAYIDLMFAGNIGTAQSVDTIIKAAALCRDIENLRWHIVGDGKEIDNIKKLAAELDIPVVFYGRKPVEEMPIYYAKADAMLVTMQEDPVISLTLPGKVQSYMAAGKPIIGAINGETAAVVEDAQCGFVGKAESPENLAEVVKQYVSLGIEERAKLGVNARNYYENHFARDKFISDLDNALKAI